VGAGSASSASNSVTPNAAALTVSTLAGSTVGSTDGTGTAAKFNAPAGITLDGSGNIYIADSLNSSIRKITSAGVVTTLVLSAGDAYSSAFNSHPAGISFDAVGNLYVPDQYYNVIKKITPAGLMTSFAGGDAWVPVGSIDGTGAAARFNGPSGTVVDSSDNIYISDTFNNSIRKISSAGVVTTVATGFYQAHGIALDSSGNLYVADTYNCLIKKITSGGVVTTLAGGGAGNPGACCNSVVDATGTAASFCNPRGVAVDSSNNVYVADTDNNLIRKITPSGFVTTIAGTGAAGSANGSAASATFSAPSSIAVDSSGKLYIADEGNNLIRIIQ
jgi:sugar lactone lactonase YvrE